MNCEICELSLRIGDTIGLTLGDAVHITCDHCGSTIEIPFRRTDAVYIGSDLHPAGTVHKFRVLGLSSCLACSTTGTIWGIPCGRSFTWPGLLVKKEVIVENRI